MQQDTLELLELDEGEELELAELLTEQQTEHLKLVNLQDEAISTGELIAAY